jgi:hypothetical protein
MKTVINLPIFLSSRQNPPDCFLPTLLIGYAILPTTVKHETLSYQSDKNGEEIKWVRVRISAFQIYVIYITAQNVDSMYPTHCLS